MTFFAIIVVKGPLLLACEKEGGVGGVWGGWWSLWYFSVEQTGGKDPLWQAMAFVPVYYLFISYLSPVLRVRSKSNGNRARTTIV